MVLPTLPFTKKDIEKLAEEHPTPFYVYNEERIRQTARQFRKAFSWVPEEAGGFKNFFAVKALPNPYILKILREEGFGADCSSLPELLLAEAAGITREEIMFTSNDTPADEFQKARQLEAIINLDDIKYIDDLEKNGGIPELICFRYNPGPLREEGVSDIIGKPEQQKYGLRTDQIFQAYRIMKEKGVKRFGLHTMIVSNMLEEKQLIETARMLFELAVQISQKHGIKFEFINLGGGVGIPYKPREKPVNLRTFSQGVKEQYENIIVKNGLHPLRVVMENGRVVTGPHGFLVTTVRHVTEKYKDFVGVDACMANLMRPALYGAYHHIYVLGKENARKSHTYDVVGSLCENNDKFAIDRRLPKIVPGDTLVICNGGAHSHAMGFQYNGKPRSAEFLQKPDSSFKMIRRAETPRDYFSTLDFLGSEFSHLTEIGGN